MPLVLKAALLPSENGLIIIIFYSVDSCLRAENNQLNWQARLWRGPALKWQKVLQIKIAGKADGQDRARSRGRAARGRGMPAHWTGRLARAQPAQHALLRVGVSWHSLNRAREGERTAGRCSKRSWLCASGAPWDCKAQQQQGTRNKANISSWDREVAKGFCNTGTHLRESSVQNAKCLSISSLD